VRKADVKHSSDILGWRPAISLDEGLQRTVHWFNETIHASTP